VIEKLESQKKCSDDEIQSLRAQLAESHTQLKNSEKLCDEKEKFILFRESQLLESEDTIYKLKQRIKTLSNSKMSEEGSRPRTRSRSQSRAEITSLATLSTDRLLDTVIYYSEELLRYVLGTERLLHMNIAEHAKDMITRASELIVDRYVLFEERYNLLREEKTNEVAECQTEIYRLSEALRGAEIEINDTSELENIIDQKDAEFNALRDNLMNIIAQKDRELEASDQLIANYNVANNLLNQRLAERDAQLRNYRRERVDMIAHYRSEQLLTRRLTRQRLLLKMANRQLQIRLLNPPIIAPPPPQRIDQVWLLLH
jgi:hypothetical protein